MESNHFSLFMTATKGLFGKLDLCPSLTWVVRMVVVFLWFMCMCDWRCFNIKALMSHSNWCRSLSKWMSVPSSHLDSPCPHTSSYFKPLSSEVLAARSFHAECHHLIWRFLHNHWPCTCCNIHSLSGCTDPTWTWVCLLHTYCDSYNS